MLKTYSRKRNQENKVIEDVHELCRLCLARAEEPVPIFGDVNSACAALPMRIMICVGHEVTQEDCLPNSICTKCHHELEQYYKFRKKCENSYRRLKAHYNAINYQEKLSEEKREENKAEEFKQLEEESQAEDVERLVIVDMFNIESNEKVEEKVEETTEIQVIEQTDEISPDISTFLNAILVELGILVKNDQGLVLQDQGVTSFQLETGDDDQLEFELVEEDEEEETVAPPLVITLPEDTSASQNEEIKNSEGRKNGRVRKNNPDGKKR